MANDKDDKFDDEHPSINDSGELLKELFREELNAIAAEKRKILSAQTGDKSTPPKTAKPPAQDKGEGRTEVGPETGTEEKRILKNYPVSGDRVEKAGQVESDTDMWSDNGVGEETAHGIKEDTPGELNPEEGIEKEELKGGKVRAGGNLSPGSSKLKFALLSVLLVAAVAFTLGSLGVVDYGELLGLTETPSQGVRKPSVAKRVPARKSIPAVTKSKQKETNNKAPDKATVPGRRRSVGIPSDSALMKARRRIIDRRSKPVTSLQEPAAVQRDSIPPASTQEPVIARPLPEPAAPTQKEVVLGQSAKPATTTQEIPMSKPSAEPVEPIQKPLVAKKPPEPSEPDLQPVVTVAAPRSEKQTLEKAAPPRENVFPGEEDLSYPYSVYHGSYKGRERAERAISEYRKKGLSAYWVKIDLGDKGVWYRVFSGYFQKRAEANEFIEQEQIADSESRHTKYANLIGLFASEEELEEEKARLSELGYCPYVIPRGNGESLLCVGAFYQKARVQSQHEELASKGVHSQIVER
jgi:hypothetical protein